MSTASGNMNIALNYETHCGTIGQLHSHS